MSTDIILDYTCNTLSVLDSMSVGDTIINGNLTIVGTVSPAIPNTLPLTGVLPTTWDPLSVTSLLVSANADFDTISAVSLNITDPNIINNNNVLNTKNYTDVSNTLHSTLHLQSTIPGDNATGNIDNTLKVTCIRDAATQLATVGINTDVAYTSSSAYTSQTLAGTCTTLTNALNGSIYSNVVYGNKVITQNLGAGVIQDLRSGYFGMLNTTVGGITSGTVIHSEYINSSNPDYLGVVQTCNGIKSTITNNVNGKITTANCMSCVYNNYNVAVSNATTVTGLNIGGWAAVIGSPIVTSYGILLDSSVRVGVTHTAIRVNNGAGATRTSGRQKRYRAVSVAPGLMTVDDEHIIVDSTSVPSVTLLALASSGVQEMTITIRNDGPNNLVILAAFGDLISPLSAGSDTSSVTILAKCSVTLQATTTVWKVLHQTNATVSSGHKIVYRVSNTLATDNILQIDSIVYVDSLIVSLLILPTLSTDTNQNVYTIRNEGPNSVSLNTSSGNTISPLSAGPAVTTMVIPSYTILRLQAITSVWKVI